MRSDVFRSVKTYSVAIASALMSSALVFTIYFTEGSLNWIAFLTGILVASVLAEAVRASRSEWLLMRRTAQVSALKEKLEHAQSKQGDDEKVLADVQHRLRIIDETLPMMLAHVDKDGTCKYHNRAFGEWLKMKAEHIDGRSFKELLGVNAYGEIAGALRQTFEGHVVRYEVRLELKNGVVSKVAAEHIPVQDAEGHVSGFYFLAEDVTKRGDVTGPVPVFVATPAQEMFVSAFSEQVSGRTDSGRHFIDAIERGEFCLYCQRISPLSGRSAQSAYHQILIRMLEEEGDLIPPGAFFPLAEKNGLMPYLDRWVAQHFLEWVASSPDRAEGSVFFICVASATMGDPEFPAFLQSLLLELRVPAASLCFEVSEQDLAMRHDATVDFIHRIKACGCRVALSGFGKLSVSFDRIRGFQVDFLKIDGSLVLNMMSDPVALAKVVAIDGVAKKIGVETIAELVENDEVLAKLREIGVDYAQGFGISRPRRLDE